MPEDDGGILREILGSHAEGALLVQRCVEAFGPPALTTHGAGRTFVMEFTHALAVATVTATAVGPKWRFRMSVSPSSDTSDKAWDLLCVALCS